MSTTSIIIYSILALVAFIAAGYFTWSYAEDRYGYNIFNTGILIRGVLAIISLIVDLYLLGIHSNEAPETVSSGLFVLLIIGLGLLLWNFIVTAKNTNIFIAILSFLYQLVVVFIIYKIINGIFKTISD